MEKPKPVSARAVLVPVVITAVLGLVLFLTAGTLDYGPGWVYLAIFGSLTLAMVLFLSVRSPELLERRARVKEGTGDKTPAFLNLFLLVYVVPGLDFRFSLSAVPPVAVGIGDALVLAGYAWILFVFRENAYAASVVTVEEGQKVITTGPYRYLRHPMYAGMLVMTLATPLALGSYWAWIPCAFFLPWLYLRIQREERKLVRELAGYQEYRDKTRYRILPGVW
jgi:protein-S-isoprenylcysteine O-methyltransferase Ste14